MRTRIGAELTRKLKRYRSGKNRGCRAFAAGVLDMFESMARMEELAEALALGKRPEERPSPPELSTAGADRWIALHEKLNEALSSSFTNGNSNGTTTATMRSEDYLQPEQRSAQIAEILATIAVRAVKRAQGCTDGAQ